ncbi:hypothetical protein BHE74_00048962, partial [Ensete ventricosum]
NPIKWDIVGRRHCAGGGGPYPPAAALPRVAAGAAVALAYRQLPCQGVATPTTGAAAPASGRAGRECHVARATDRGQLSPMGLVATDRA